MRVDLYLKLASAVLFAVLVCFAATAYSPATEIALAQGPPEDVTYFNEYAAGEACEFPVRIEVSGLTVYFHALRKNIGPPGIDEFFSK